MMDDKLILDACCGSRMFWFDRENPNVLYQDVRNADYELCDGRELHVRPDIIVDFTKMPHADSSFYHVVWDPPHLKKLGQNTWMAQKYGVLLPSWEHDLKEGFLECMRVLKPMGTLIFKWNEIQIKLNDVLKLFPQQPLYGHVTGKHGRTIWLCFMKL
jgi:hypothetical protein